MSAWVTTALGLMAQVHWLRFFLSALAILILWRIRATGAGEALVNALNDIHLNVWSILLIGWGVLLTINGKDGVGQVLITGGFALLRGPTSSRPPNGDDQEAGSPPTPAPVPSPRSTQVSATPPPAGGV